jgi:chaperone required for assembly of F1-ATPase
VSWSPKRRFWQATGTRPEEGGFAVLLDTRPLRTPAGAHLLLPSRALAEAIAAEWAAVEAEIRPEHLPLTRAANSAIDRVSAQRDAVIDAIAAYGATDLVCYRAAEPAGLVARQCAGWDPWLAWSARYLGAPLHAIEGVMHHPQPDASLAALREAVAARDAFELVGLYELVSLSGSLILGLAVAEGALDAGAAWELSRIDEAWQEEHWGLDSEAERTTETRRRAFLQARDLLALLAGEAASRSAGNDTLN